MSLFESASLIVTPNGVKEDKLYSIKPTDGSGDLVVTRATTATRVNSAGLIESVAVNVPRLDYSNGTCPSILVEPQRTNLLLRSEEFDNASWQKVTSNVSINSIIAPNGFLSADKLIEDNSNSQHRIDQNTTSVIGTNTLSVFAKKAERNLIWLRIGTSGAYFNLNLGTISLISGVTADIKDYGNGWYRCIITRVSTVANEIARINIIQSEGIPNYQGVIGNGIYIWGAQLEAGANATSYIPTVASSVTRNADVISKTSVSSLIGQTEGTIYAEIKVSKLLGTASRYIFHLSDGTTNNRIYMAFSGLSSNILRARIFNGGTLQCSIDSSTISATGTYKLALAYKNNDIVFYINGVQIGTDTSATIPTCSQVDLGHNYAGASQFNDSINNANVWKTRLSNSELATLTTI